MRGRGVYTSAVLGASGAGKSIFCARGLLHFAKPQGLVTCCVMLRCCELTYALDPPDHNRRGPYLATLQNIVGLREHTYRDTASIRRSNAKSSWARVPRICGVRSMPPGWISSTSREAMRSAPRRCHRTRLTRIAAFVAASVGRDTARLPTDWFCDPRYPRPAGGGNRGVGRRRGRMRGAERGLSTI